MHFPILYFQPDNITALIGSKLQPGFFTNQDLFLAELSKEKEFRPFGTLLHVYHRTDTGFISFLLFTSMQ